jgi:hypothetical protein
MNAHQKAKQSQFYPNDVHPSIHSEGYWIKILPREDETMKFIVGSEGVAMAVTQPECPLRVAVKVSWRLEDEVSMTLVLDTLDPGNLTLYFR